MPGYVLSDRGPSFMSDKLKACLFSKGITSSHTIPYNPTGNSQVERYNWYIMEISFTCTQVFQHTDYRVGKGPA